LVIFELFKPDPLQREYEGKDSRISYLLGIVSYGSKLCGYGRQALPSLHLAALLHHLADMAPLPRPGMYTRVESFLPWIRASLRP
jgi:hypothetical protein